MAIEETFGSVCYFLSATRMTFPAAQADCIARGGILAEPAIDQGTIGTIMTGLRRVFPTEIAILNTCKL